MRDRMRERKRQRERERGRRYGEKVREREKGNFKILRKMNRIFFSKNVHTVVDLR